MFRKFIVVFAFLLLHHAYAQGPRPTLPSNEIQIGLQKLNTLGTVLYFAAHPDDENTRLIAWLAQEKKYRTAYLSLTRGDGGQNLIGTEQGIDLGLIRTQELLAARNIDKGEQFFSSAYDFGFSKTFSETFNFWDKETALREAVWIIRKFRPDVIINRFPPDKRGGHGHHQASAMLSHEAFVAAADPTKFPEQLTQVAVWQAKRLLWNTANFGGMNNTSDDQLKIDIGAYNPLLGKSYGEIASVSRSQHKSQGFGAAASRGSSTEYFDHVAGTKANQDLMEGVNTTWNRLPNTQAIQALIEVLNKEFEPNHPEKSISNLLKLRSLISNINDTYWRDQKLKETEDLIIACAGLWFDAISPSKSYAEKEEFQVNVEAIVRNPSVQVEVISINDQAVNGNLETNKLWRNQQAFTWNIATQPYWLEKPNSLGKFDVKPALVGHPTNPDKPQVKFTFKVNGETITRHQAIQYRTVDPVRGEIYQPLVIVPAITAELVSKHMLTTNSEAKTLVVTFNQNTSKVNHATISIDNVEGWDISPQAVDLDFSTQKSVSKVFQIKPKNNQSAKGIVQFKWNGSPLKSIQNITYEHIPNITWFPTAEVAVQNVELVNPIKKVGYLHGAGDLVPQSLEQIGIETTLLSENLLSKAVLAQYDAIIVGIRYFNVSSKGNETSKALLDYANNGGTVLIQYQVNSRLSTNHLGPFPFNLSRIRVTEEDASVKFDKNDPAFVGPNKITAEDFEHWVQERGLYFATNIDKQYRTPIQINDQDEPSNNGALLIAPHGKGKFVYTSLAFFRQLPAGVPGAYRLFVNLLAKE